MEFTFLDDQIQQLYVAEQQLGSAYTSFSFIAILVAGVGFIGLSTFLIARMRKEISIRKVFGSTTTSLIFEMYRMYRKIILMAIVLSWGLGYFLMKQWLDSFAYQTELSVLYFIWPTVIMISILLLTTGMQTIQASLSSPIKNLREQ